jgi:hypothetical protein
MDPKAIAYPPLDTLKPIAENVWLVDSGPMRAMGMPLPVRMTVICLGDGTLLLHSPTPFSANLGRALEAVGPVRHLVAPNIAHWTFLKDWQAHYADAVTSAAPGLRDRRQVRSSGVRLDRDLGSADTPAWAGEIVEIFVHGVGGFCEVALFHKASRTLVLTDLVQNLEPGKLPVWMRLPARLAGNAAPDGRAPAYLRAVVKLRGQQPRDAARALLALNPDRVVFTHGRWFDSDGTARLRRSLDWLVA